MAEYIERQAAIDAFNRAVQNVGILDADDIETVFGMLSSADVVQVARCKDCKWAMKSTELPGWYMCKCEEAFDYYAKPDDFCSYGERKE